MNLAYIWVIKCNAVEFIVSQQIQCNVYSVPGTGPRTGDPTVKDRALPKWGKPREHEVREGTVGSTGVTEVPAGLGNPTGWSQGSGCGRRRGWKNIPRSGPSNITHITAASLSGFSSHHLIDAT